MKKIFIFFGAVALTLGAIGIVLPVLPTTPLLLLALFCFNRGSEKLSLWFKGTTLYKRYLAEYVEKKSLTMKQKIIILLFAGTIMTVSFLAIENQILRAILVIGFVMHNYVFIFKIKSCKPCRSKEDYTAAHISFKSK